MKYSVIPQLFLLLTVVLEDGFVVNRDLLVQPPQGEPLAFFPDRLLDFLRTWRSWRHRHALGPPWVHHDEGSSSPSPSLSLSVSLPPSLPPHLSLSLPPSLSKVFHSSGVRIFLCSGTQAALFEHLI